MKRERETRPCSEADAAFNRECGLIDDFLAELSDVAGRFDRWFVDARCGIRGCHAASAHWFCPLAAIWFIRTGQREHLHGPGYLELLFDRLDKEMHLGPVSLRLAQAIDDPFGDKDGRNAALGRRLMKAVGLGIKKAATGGGEPADP